MSENPGGRDDPSAVDRKHCGGTAHCAALSVAGVSHTGNNPYGRKFDKLIFVVVCVLYDDWETGLRLLAFRCGHQHSISSVARGTVTFNFFLSVCSPTPCKRLVDDDDQCRSKEGSHHQTGPDRVGRAGDSKKRRVKTTWLVAQHEVDKSLVSEQCRLGKDTAR